MREKLPESIARIARVFCGCGDPAEAWGWVLYILDLKYEPDGRRSPLPFFEAKNGPEWISLYLLAHLKLVEHGTSICGCWLTPDGKEALEFLRKHGADWFVRGEFIDASGVSYGNMEDE